MGGWQSSEQQKFGEEEESETKSAEEPQGSEVDQTDNTGKSKVTTQACSTQACCETGLSESGAYVTLVNETTKSVTDIHMGTEGEISSERREGDSMTVLYKRSRTDETESRMMPDETTDQLSQGVPAQTVSARAAGITKLIEGSQALKELGDFDTAKRLALQAMIGAYEAMDEYMEAEETSVSSQQLADWFGLCAVILNEMEVYLPAIRCFYTAIVFDSAWDELQHIQVSSKLWNSLLKQDPQLLKIYSDRIFDLMDKVFAIANLAVKRGLFHLASLTCSELSMVYNILTYKGGLCRRGFELYKPEQRFYAATKPISVLNARCQYHMHQFDVAKKICADILTKVCDYDSVEALELWALVLVKEGQYDIAQKKICHALKYTKQGDGNEARLNQLLQSISRERDLKAEQVAEVDSSWLEGTAAEENKNKKPKVTASDCSAVEKSKRIVKKKQIPRYKEYHQPLENTDEPHKSSRKHAKQEQRLKDKSVLRIVEESQRDRSRCSSECSVETVSSVASDANSYYSGRWSDVDDSDDNTQSDSGSSSSNIFDTFTEEDFAEEKSFYEQSREFFHNNDSDENEMSDDVLLRSGLELNMSFMSRFEEKHPNSNKREPFYDEFLPKEALRERMLKHPDVFIRCKLQIEGSHLSHCTPLDSSTNIETVEISGRSKAGQVFNEDEVVVQLLDSDHEQENKRYGKIIGVWERKRYPDVKHPVFICTLDDMETHLVRPMCKTVPKIHILNDEIWKTCPKMKKHKIEVYTYDHSYGELTDPKILDVNRGCLNKYVFLVAFINWRRQMIYPTGAIIRVLPYGESLNRGFMLLNLKHEVPTLYQKAVVDRTESITRRCGDEIDQIYLEDRVNLTDLKVFTIDPPGSKDLDDALSVEKVEGGFKVGVHIADVSHFIQKGDPIDIEAKRRTTTFYPGIDGKLPRNMLPEPFSTKLCSLLPNRTRLTLSVFFHLSANGKSRQMVGPSFEIAKTFIRSSQQFTYRQVQDIIDDKASHRLEDEIKCLYQLAASIRKERLKDSMFALEISNETEPLDDDVNETLEAHFVVEEFMIMANRAVATKLVRNYPDSVPLRCQPHPTKESMMAFIKKNDPYIDTLVKLQDKHICEYKTPKLDSLIGTSGGNFQALSVPVPNHLWGIISSSTTDCSKVLRTDDLYPLQHLVHQHWLDIQERAEYKCSSNIKERSATFHHFSLEVYPYTHFTSPIRRYIDLVIHRLLHAALDKVSSPYNKGEVESICANVNSRAKHAKDFQRECKILKQAIDLKRKPKMVTCYINEVSDRCLTMSSPNLKHVSKAHKELSLSLLDVGFKPETGEEAHTNTEFVKATWRKRIYDSKGVSSLTPHSQYPDEKRVLNPNSGTVLVPLQQWARIVKCAVESRHTDMKRAIRNTHTRLPEMGLDDVSTESLDPNKMQPYSIFTMSFKHGQTVKVQMAAMPWRGLLAPQPVLYNMTNNVKLCLQHTDDPVLHLSNYSTRATCPQYKSVEMYLERWIPLLEMEAAVCAVTNEESCFINNVPIKFENMAEGKIIFPIGFCEVRNIEFSGTSSEFEFDEYFEEGGQSYDWLCLRRLLPESDQTSNKTRVMPSLKSVWIGHAKVTSVTKKKLTKDSDDGKIIVKFRLHNSPPLTDDTVDKDNRFCVEILRKSEVDRRTESYMKQLRTMDETLAYTIALNKGAIPKLDQEHLEMAAGIERDLYIPPTEDVRPLPRNNQRQQEAIDKALKNRFTLIQGPPGTGKTYTGIKLLYLFDKVNGMISREGGVRHQVLFCGPSNKSVDLVARWMLRRLGSLCPKFIRVYGRSIEAIDYPIPGRTFLSKRSTRDLKANPELSSVTLHHLIRQKGKLYAERIKALDKMFKDSDYAPQRPDVIKDYVHMVREASIDEVRKHDVILCTTAVGSNPKILKASSVFQVIIDEAGMCPEPQCLVPIIATKAEQVVLIGDHKQLRPIIKCKQAAELGLDKSLFERYAESDTAKNVQFTMLNIQYRMNPQLCRFPSQMFYDGELLTESGMWMRDTMDIWPRERGFSYPHVLIPVEGEENSLTVSTDEGNEHSRSNTKEAELVVKLFRYFVDEGIQANDINIVSQYNAQCADLRTRLRNEGFENFNVTTVVSSQGGEWDYVIFSTVRSLPEYKIEKRPTLGWCKQNLGFITDENQINVALTRARKGLVIVGNPNLLKCDRVWGRLISHYQNTGCVLSPEEFPPPHRTRQERLRAAQRRNEQRYGDDRFTPGEATSYQGNFDNIDDSEEEEDGEFRRVRRRGRGRGRSNCRR